MELDKIEMDKNYHLINVNKVYKSYKSSEVLNNITFTVSENEFISIVGPSGCGKTTLLKIIGGVLEQSSGEVTLQDKIVNTNNIKGEIGFVFQKSVLLPWRTVYDNIKLPFEILGRNSYEPKILSLLKLVNMSDFKKKYPHQLSGGEEQRIAIIRALAFDPLVLLMDEPFGALDAILRKTMNFELLKIWHDQKKTVLFVTHDIDEAIFMSDRVIVLGDKPTSIKKILEINLERPRKWKLKTSSEFAELVRKAEELLNIKN